VSALLVFGTSGAIAAFHGVAQTKGCTSPTKIGDPYTCSAQILNVVDTGGDTVRVSDLSDVVHSAGGDVTPGSIFASTGLVFTGAVACVGGSGAGTSADPYIGATSCLLPFGTSITTKPFSIYTVQPADFNLPNHQLTDTVTWAWNNTCVSDPDNDCTTGPQLATAGSSAVVQKLVSATSTDIHNAAHQVVTTVGAGSTVHDFVTVTGQPGQPPPSGNVNIDWFLNGDCTGNPAVNSGSIGPLDAAGTFDATGFAFTVNAAGSRAFKAHYEGDPTYLASDGPCEPLRVVDANIQITPATADNPVATNHVLTITVNAINGTLAAGTATATIVSGPGSFVGSPTCNYAGGGASASCTVTITSVVSGTTEVSATSNISVNGQSITRTTNTAANTAAGGSGNALKNWTSLTSGRVTGGGSIFATVNGVPNIRVTHGFELRCDPNDKRQSLEINWDGGNNFHLDKIINSVVCFDDPTTQPPPPPGTAIDTYAGNTLFNGHAGFHGFGYAVGTGTCNKQPATIYFILIDAGEPGTSDTAEYHIVSSGCTLDAGPAQLLKGNHQFHKN
jgi:hypothetical protein